MDPSGSRVTVRDARLQDVPDLERIESAAFKMDRMSRRSLHRHVQSPTADVLVACHDRQAVGYAVVFYRRSTPVARLYSIATLPAARGKGVARALLRASERSARRRGCSAMRLEVRTDNAPAIRLYELEGYAPFGRYDSYYEDGAPALRFAKPLTQSDGARAA
jgi:[ribosomal protein S18]-alanine N-acetyltransferase